MLVFVDFEASSLSKRSYPIEVGWVGEDGLAEGHLIRPAPGWTEWDVTAEAVHGISRRQLEAEGEPHDLVCARLVEAFEGHEVHASAPTWDGHWLSMLLRASGLPRHLLRLNASEDAFMEAAMARTNDRERAEQMVADARAVVATQPVQHRAVADARRDLAILQEIRSQPAERIWLGGES